MIRKPGLVLSVIVLVGVPLLAGALWLASGREVLTKPFRSVTVEVRDEVFGGTNTEVHSVRGPILGYYIGLDIVGAAVLAAIGGALVLWLAARRRLPPGRGAEGELQHD